MASFNHLFPYKTHVQNCAGFIQQLMKDYKKVLLICKTFQNPNQFLTKKLKYADVNSIFKIKISL